MRINTLGLNRQKGPLNRKVVKDLLLRQLLHG
jgi:hypothetical protein